MRAGLGDGPHDAAGLGADVGAAVAADLGLVADAAEGDPHERAAQGAGDRLAEAGLADAGRPDEGDDRATPRPVAALGVAVAASTAPLGPQLAHGEELDDAVLDLVEAVVVGVEHLAGVGQVELVGGALAPRELEHACRARCGSSRARAPAGWCARAGRSPASTALRDAPRAARRPLGQLGAVRLGRVVVVALAELLADGGQLLAQQVLALRASPCRR